MPEYGQDRRRAGAASDKDDVTVGLLAQREHPVRHAHRHLIPDLEFFIQKVRREAAVRKDLDDELGALIGGRSVGHGVGPMFLGTRNIELGILSGDELHLRRVNQLEHQTPYVVG